MPHPVPSPLSAALDETLAGLPEIDVAFAPEPVHARASRHEGAIVVSSDGTGIRVELSHPIRLDAETLADELTSAANEALAEAQSQVLAAIAGPGGADLGRIRQLGSELGAAYDAELRQLDARIARMAGE